MSKTQECVICGRYFSIHSITKHVNSCLDKQEFDPDFNPSKDVSDEENKDQEPPSKRTKLEETNFLNQPCTTPNSHTPLQRNELNLSPTKGINQKSVSQSVHSVAKKSSKSNYCRETSIPQTNKNENIIKNVSSDKGSSGKSFMWSWCSPDKKSSSSEKNEQETSGLKHDTRIGLSNSDEFTIKNQATSSKKLFISGDEAPLRTESDTFFQFSKHSNSNKSSKNDYSVQKHHLNNHDNQHRDTCHDSKVSQSHSLSSDEQFSDILDNGIPLAEQLRPLDFNRYIGQENTVGKGKLLRELLECHQVPSMILWGPPGCGKTTLARIIAKKAKETHNTRFTQLSATTAGIADVKEIVKVAKNDFKITKRRTILFIDEIHRFNKLQQDSFLPHVEDGTLTLIGATTENPSFQVNNALLSRCRVVILEKHSVDHVVQILHTAARRLNISISEDLQGTRPGLSISSDALTCLANFCDGDARGALNGLETVVRSKRGQLACKPSVNGAAKESCLIEISDVKEALQRSHVQYDRKGDEHYHCASALQKSIRGSSDNGAIYWMTRMFEGGEDPLFIARRLLVCASEDIGLADPQALPIAMATFQACQVLGKPECAINLAHCTTYLARAPKSFESTAALTAARRCINEYNGPLPGVPLHLRNASSKLAKELGYGKGYKWSHVYSEEAGKQEYLPKELLHMDFYTQHRGMKK